MRKRMKQTLMLVASIILIHISTSCSSDSNSLDNIWGAVATVHTDDQGYAKYFTLDDGKTMLVLQSRQNYKPSNERVGIYYSQWAENYEGYDYAIELLKYDEDILTKYPIYIPKDNAHLQDSIGHNGIEVVSMWAKQGYLTIRFKYLMGNKDIHMINMVSDTNNNTQEGSKAIQLQFRHNRCEDEEHYYSREQHVSFKLNDYIAANSGNQDLAFEVLWIGYDGVQRKETLKFPLPPVINPASVKK